MGHTHAPNTCLPRIKKKKKVKRKVNNDFARNMKLRKGQWQPMEMERRNKEDLTHLVSVHRYSNTNSLQIDFVDMVKVDVNILNDLLAFDPMQLSHLLYLVNVVGTPDQIWKKNSKKKIILFNGWVAISQARERKKKQSKLFYLFNCLFAREWKKKKKFSW